MSSLRTNSHLNIFNYYSYSDEHDSKENNLSRALAITLGNDKELLNEVFKDLVLDNSYNDLFALDYNSIDSEEIYIDIQTSASSDKLVERSYGQYIGVLLGNFNNDFSQEEIKNIDSNNTNNPIPDILIGVKDILIVIETKLYGSLSDFGQLKNHVESIIENQENRDDNNNEKPNIIYKSAKWNNILKKAMKLYDPDEGDHVFIDNFIDFVRRDHTGLMPVLPLNEIEVKDELEKEDYKIKRINQRLDVLKTILTQKEEYYNRDELMYQGNDIVIPLDVKWAKLANIFYNRETNSFNLKIWPADTKGQGNKLYKENVELDWLDNSKINGFDYNLNITPYIKFANWNKGVGWIRDAINKEEIYKKTHCYNTFKNIAGRWKRSDDNNQWEELEAKLDEVIGSNWKADVDWSGSFINSGKTTIDVSFGIEVEVEIPFNSAKMLDKDKDKSQFADEIYNVLMALKDMIEK